MRYLSLCSGIEATSVAWQPLGWQPVAFAETDHFCRAFLEYRWPEVPNLGDLGKIRPRMLRGLGPIDVVVGGTPCQDLSIAGQRRGLAGSRSRLFFDYVRIFNAARRICGARFAIWENVPGALSNRRGADFARVVSTFTRCDFEPPSDGWGNEGMACGPGGLVEWCVLDAQWFGVAQRRERLFVILDSGNWKDRSPVLLEPEGLRGDSAPRRAPGSRVTGTLRRSSLDGSSACGGDGRDAQLVTPSDVGANVACDRDVAGPLLSNTGGHGWRTGAEEAAGNHLIVDEVADPLVVKEGGTYTHERTGNFRLRNVVAEVAGALTAGHDHGAHAGRQANIVACFDETQLTHPENRSTCAPDTAALAASARPPAIALALRDRDGAALEQSEVAPALRAADGGASRAFVAEAEVRRLTPIECERLMGLPDDWTAIPYKPRRRRRARQTSDTVRYAALGNSIPTTLLAWIGRKLQEAV